MSKLMKSISGVRGIVGETLTPELILAYSSAFAKFCKYGKIVVGRDTRVTGELVKSSVIAGLVSSGCEVVDLGIATTPSTQVMVKELNADGAIVITASHNGVEWNAMKFVSKKALFLDVKEADRFFKIVDQGKFKRVKWDKIKKVTNNSNSFDVLIKRVLALDYIKINKIKKRKFKVVVDAVNGAGSVICPLFLEKLGCEVIELNCKPTGLFAHEPEPTPANLIQLCKTVKKHKADIGFAIDPDADRLAIVSDKGIAIGEEYTLAIAGNHVLRKNPGNVTVNLSTSRMIEDVAAKYNCKVERTPVGEINVSTRLLKNKSVFGGEGNGGVMVPESHPARDAIAGIALVLQELMDSKTTITKYIAKELTSYCMEKHKINTSGLDVEKALKNFQKGFSDAKIDTRDGLRADLGDSWIQLRKSNTEPIVRLIAESPSKKQTAELVKKATLLIKGKK